MRRIALFCALMSLGGCWCFDGAYMNFCRETGRCDGGEEGPVGEPAALSLSALPDTEVGACLPVKVELQDSEGRRTSFSSAQTLALSSPTEVLFYSDCSSSSPFTQLPVPAGAVDVPFAVQTSRFGRNTIVIEGAGLPGISRSLLASGDLKFRKPGYAVPLDGGCVPLEVVVQTPTLFDQDLSPAVMPTQAVFDLKPGQFRIGRDMACATTSGTLIPVAFDGVTATIWVGNSGASPVGDQGTLEVSGSRDAGLRNGYTANLFAECIPQGGPCSDSADCCSGNCAAESCIP